MRVLVEDNLNDLARRINTEKATDMKHVTHHTQDAIAWQGSTRRRGDDTSEQGEARRPEGISGLASDNVQNIAG